MGSSRSSGLSESLLLSCLDDFLVLHDFLVEVDLWDCRDHFVKLQLVIAPCWISASVLRCFGTGWLQLSSELCFSSYFAMSRSQSFGFPCLLLTMLFSCLPLTLLFVLPAVGFAHSRFFSSSLQIFVFFSLSSYQCCFTSFFSSCHHWLVGIVVLSRIHTACSLAVVPSVLLFQSHVRGKSRLRGKFLASSQHHYSALRPS